MEARTIHFNRTDFIYILVHLSSYDIDTYREETKEGAVVYIKMHILAIPTLHV